MRQPEAKAGHCCRHEGRLPLGLCIPHCSKEQEEDIHIDRRAGPAGSHGAPWRPGRSAGRAEVRSDSGFSQSLPWPL